MHHFALRAGELFAEDVSVPELAERFGTPLYVYSHATLVRHVNALQSAFTGVDHLLAYSVKANPNLAVIRTLAAEGAGADVVSGGELQRALRAGIPPEKIVFSGVGKRRDELAAAVDAGIYCCNVEVKEELDVLAELARERGRPIGVALRVNPDVDAHSHSYISVGRRVNKFGLALEIVPELYRQAAATDGLIVRGLDCHIGSQVTNMQPFEQALARVARLAESLVAEGLPLETIDVGGGLGVRYKDESPPTPSEYATGIVAQVGHLGARIVLEPGRVIVANAGIFVTRVLYRKESGGKTFLIADGAMNDMPRPSLYGAQHAVQAVRDGSGTIVADVVGPVCESGDFLVREADVPDAQPGDLLAVLGAGAYCRSMASNYNSRPRAAEVLVRGAEAHLVQERETIDDLLAHERIPDFLAP